MKLWPYCMEPFNYIAVAHVIHVITLQYYGEYNYLRGNPKLSKCNSVYKTYTFSYPSPQNVLVASTFFK